jgi:hypothetical protein
MQRLLLVDGEAHNEHCLTAQESRYEYLGLGLSLMS